MCDLFVAALCRLGYVYGVPAGGSGGTEQQEAAQLPGCEQRLARTLSCMRRLRFELGARRG